jgi:hypothetical protein
MMAERYIMHLAFLAGMGNGRIYLIRVEDVKTSSALGRGLGVSLESNTGGFEHYFVEGGDQRVAPGHYVSLSELLAFTGDSDKRELEEALGFLVQELPADAVECMNHYMPSGEFDVYDGVETRTGGVVADLLSRPEMRRLFADVAVLRGVVNTLIASVPEKLSGRYDSSKPAFDQLVDYVEWCWKDQGLLKNGTIQIYRKGNEMYLPFNGRVCASEAVVYLRPDTFKGELVERVRALLKHKKGSEVDFFDEKKNELPGNKTSENGFAARAILYFDLGIRLSSRIHKERLITRKVFYDASYELVHAAAREKGVREFGTGNSYYVSSVRRDLILPLVQAVIARNS